MPATASATAVNQIRESSGPVAGSAMALGMPNAKARAPPAAREVDLGHHGPFREGLVAILGDVRKPRPSNSAVAASSTMITSDCACRAGSPPARRLAATAIGAIAGTANESAATRITHRAGAACTSLSETRAAR